MQLPENAIPGSEAWETKVKLDALEAALVARDPKLPGHLAAMHEHLQQFPEMLHLLSPEDFGKVIAAHKAYSSVEITTARAKAATSKAVNKISVSSII